MAFAAYLDAVQKIYIAFYQRPADPAGLRYWAQRMDAAGGDQAAVIDAFASSNEAKALYGEINNDTIGTVIDAIYQALYNRAPDEGGKQFYVDAFKAGKYTAGTIALNILNGASNDDAVAIANKLGVANEFTKQVDGRALTDPEFGSGTNFNATYAGDADAVAARTILAGVTSNPASVLDASKVTVEINDKIADATDPIKGQTGGKTFMLTKGLDNVAGTAGNDTIIGSIDNSATPNVELNTLSSLDIVNGGAGIDTLKINVTGGPNVVLPNMTNVEIVQVESTVGATVDTSTIAGVTNLNVTKAAGAVAATAAATTDVSVAVKGIAGTTVTVNGGKDVNVTTTDAAAAIDVGATGTDPVGAVTITATGAAVANNASPVMGNISVGGGKTVNVTQKATSDASAIVADGTPETVTQGNVVVTANATTTDVTIKQDAAVTAQSRAAVTGVTEVASVKFTKLNAGESVTISGLTFTAAAGKDLTAEQVAQAFANLSASAIKPTDVTSTTATGDTNGGSASANGTFTGALLADWTSGAASGDTVVFTGKANTAMATDLVASAKATVTTTTQGVTAVSAQNTLGVANGTVTIAGAAALKTVTVDGYAASTGAAGITGGTNNALDTISLANGGDFEIDSAAATLGLTLANVNGNVDVAAGTKTLNAAVSHAKATDTTTLVSASAETVNVTGTGNVAGNTTAGLTAATAINTSGMTGGKATFTIADGTATSYTGGAGVDSVTVSNAGTAITKAIDLGAGDDTLTLNGTVVVPTVTLKGGDGTDTIAMNGASAESLSANATFAGKIEGFEKLSVFDLAGGQTDTVNMANMGGINYVIYAGSIAGAPTQEVQTFSVTNGVTATKTNEVQTIDFTGASITTVAPGTLVVGGVTIATITDGDDAATIAAKVAAALNNSPAVAGAGGFAVKATALGTGVTITYDTRSGDVSPIAIADTTGTSAGVSTATVATATAFAANAPSLTVGGVAVALVAQDKDATGALVAGSGDDTASEVATKIAAALDLNATYDAAGTSATGSNVVVKFTANADVNPIALTPAGGVAFGAVEETTKGSVGGALGNLTLTNVLNNSTLELAAAGTLSTVTMKDATGSTDSFNIVTKVNGDISFGMVDVAGVETLKLNAVDTTPGTAAAPTINTASLTVKADKATSLTIEGNSNVTLTLDAATTKLATIDAGTLTGNLIAGNSHAGANTIAMTITGGKGADQLKASVGADAKADVLNGGDGNDTLYAGSNGAKLTGGAGNDLFIVTANSATVGNKESNTYSEILDFQAGDLLQLQASNTAGTAAIDVTGFTKLAASLNENTAVFSDFVNAAIKEAGAGAATWFNYKGDAYVVIDSATDSAGDVFKNGEDLIIKLTGVNGDNLSWNSDYATVALI